VVRLAEPAIWGENMKAISAALLSALPLLPVQAQQQNSITLSCNGTSKLTATAAADLKPDPITNMGIIVNLADRTVTFTDYVTPVTGITATLVSFSGRQTPVALGVKGKPFTIDGSIDRVTGHAEIGWWYENVGNNAFWELTCRSATRLF
jgi:hypothetical protein